MTTEHLVNGLASGIIGSLLIWLLGMYRERNVYQARKAEIINDADKAKQTLKAEAEHVRAEMKKDTLREWERIAAYHSAQCDALRVQNANQQREIDSLRLNHEDCERRHGELERKIASIEGTVTKLANGH